jgi:hypothetical protein
MCLLLSTSNKHVNDLLCTPFIRDTSPVPYVYPIRPEKPPFTGLSFEAKQGRLGILSVPEDNLPERIQKRLKIACYGVYPSLNASRTHLSFRIPGFQNYFGEKQRRVAVYPAPTVFF